MCWLERRSAVADAVALRDRATAAASRDRCRCRRPPQPPARHPQPPTPPQRRRERPRNPPEEAVSAFAYRTASFTPRTCRCRRSPAQFGTPCYVYSRAALEGAYREFDDAFAGMPPSGLLRAEGELQPRGPRPLRAAGQRLRHRLRRRAFARAGGGRRPGARSSSPASARPSAEMRDGARRRHPMLQRGVRRRARSPQRGRGRGGQARADQLSRQPRRRPEDASVHLDRPQGKQVRRRLRRRACALPARGEPAPRRRARHRHAHRLPDHRARAVPRSGREGARPRRRTARPRASRSTHVDLGGGLGIRYRDEHPVRLSEYAEMVRGLFAGRAETLLFEPGRRLVGDAGVLLTQVEFLKPGEAKQLRDRRRRDERPAASRAL